jgi:putative transcriptional regulator
LRLNDVPGATLEKTLIRSLIAFIALMLALPAAAQSASPLDDEAVFLVAHPAFRDLDYRESVVIAAPIPNNGGHVGVIINRPTQRSLTSLFPEHEPSRKVIDPVFYGGPFSRGALVALIKSDANPGAGSVPIMKNLFLSFRANVIDKAIEQTPNDARYYVGYIGWRPGELKSEVERGLWSVQAASLEAVFRKDTDGLWEELIVHSRRIQAGLAQPRAALR